MQRLGQIQDAPGGLELRGDLDVGDGGPRGAVGMRMVDDLQLEALVPHVFQRQGHVTGVHDGGDVGALFGCEGLQVGELRSVEVGEVGSFRRDDVGDLVVVEDSAVFPGQHATALVRGQFTRVSDHFVEDVSGDAQRTYENAYSPVRYVIRGRVLKMG